MRLNNTMATSDYPMLIVKVNSFRLSSVKRSVEEAKEALERTLDSTLTAEQRAIAADQFLDKEELWVREIAKEIRRLREQQVKLLHLLFWVECSNFIIMKYQNLHYVNNTFS